MLVGEPAINFSLADQMGKLVILADSIKISPAMLVFYPGDFTPVCTAQLCDYRDNIAEFNSLSIKILGISPNDQGSHKRFIDERKFPFSLLSDIENRVAKQYGCSSIFMLGKVSRAIFIVNTEGIVVYRYVEPTILTRRKSGVLLQEIKQLRNNGGL